ncbi:MAG TPA: hypothetical protein VN256_00505 [Pyrinomonadaceae bacterium]|nr:hypothetical protein [Pyrinomonadaceae bacterium]
MVNRLVLLTALIVTMSSVGLAQSQTAQRAGGVWPARAHAPSQTQAAEELAKTVADAFAAGELGRLDAERPYLGTVRIRVEHSITGGIVTRSFKTLAAAERWLNRGNQDSQRNGGTLRRCRRGTCTFEQEGMLHNNLYLQRITYGLRRGRPYVKAIHIIDGD